MKNGINNDYDNKTDDKGKCDGDSNDSGNSNCNEGSEHHHYYYYFCF